MAATDRFSGISDDVAMKAPCRAATTANITLSGTQTIDGVAVVQDDRVLVKNQTDTTANGIYIADTGAWSRAKDFDGARDVLTGTLVYVILGTTNADTFWRVSTTGDPVPGTAMAFAQSDMALSGVSAFIQTLVDDPDAATARATLGAGDASGPGSSTNNNLASFNGTGGKTLKDSGIAAANVAQIGLQTIWVPAIAMYCRTTNGAATGSVESTTNKVMSKSLDYDQTTQEFAQFAIQFPKSWNEGTVTFQPVWSAASGSGGVVWALQGVALSDDDAIDTAFGTEQTSTDTLIATGDVHVGPVSAAITIGGSPLAGDWVAFQIKRNPADVSDTLNADARLLGVRIFFTTDAGNDA